MLSDKSLDEQKHAVSQRADDLHTNGVSLYQAGNLDAALAAFEGALFLQPASAIALNSRGFVLKDMGHLEEALACFQKSVILDPGYATARLNLGFIQLKLGDWSSGWENHESRWTGSDKGQIDHLGLATSSLPQWNGEILEGAQSLLVIGEQGFGDILQFSRYLKLAKERFAKVGFFCFAPTLRLMEWSFGEDVVLFSRMPTDLTTWDWQCPMMSLPRAFGTRVDTVPASIPYLKVPKVAVAYWHDRLVCAAPERFRIGLAWAGRPTHQCDARRSLRFEQLLPLIEDERFTWVSLQKWGSTDSPLIPPVNVDWIDWTEELTDFADTAALASNLDLVISIDSAMVHLAGALNRPVWMLNRFDGEWRWLSCRDDSPWYPSLRLFNQPVFGDWSSVIDKVQAALQQLTDVPSEPRNRRPKTSAQVMHGMTPTTRSLSASELSLAGELHRLGRLQEAEQLLQRILRDQPREASALHLLGVIAYQLAQPARAIQLIEQAISIDPQSPLFLSNLGEMCRQQNRLQEAIAYGQRAITLAPKMASAHSNLGVALYDAGVHDKAEACHLTALVLDRNCLQSLNNLGSIQRIRKDRATAKQWYRQALAVNPDYLDALSNLAAVLLEENLTEEAEIYLARVRSLALVRQNPSGA